jgi:hypothetical protein
VIEVARAEIESDALAAVADWKARNAEIARHLEPADVLIDRMRGKSTLWYRVRINLTNVPAALRPAA